MKTNLIYTIATALHISCGQDFQDSSHLANSVDQTLNIGSGYSTAKVRPTGHRCMSGQEKSREVGTVAINFDRVDDVSKLFKQTGFKTGGSFTYKLASGSAKAKLLETSESTNRSLSFLSHSKFVHRIEHLQNPRAAVPLNPVNCGNSYVSQVGYGSEMLVQLQFTFESREYKKAFEGSIKGGMKGMFDVEADISRLETATKKHTKLKMSFLAYGTNLTTLKEIFKGRDFVSCSLDNFSSCQEVLASIIDYQMGTFAAESINSSYIVDKHLSPYPGGTLGIDRNLKQLRKKMGQFLITSHSQNRKALRSEHRVLCVSKI